MELAKLLVFVHAGRVKRDLLAGVVHVDVHDVHGLASLVVRVKLSPQVEYGALNVTIELFLVEIVEAYLRGELLVPDRANRVLILVKVNVVVHHVKVDRFDLHGQALTVLRKVPNEEPMLARLSDFTLDLDFLVLVRHFIITNEVIELDGRHILELLGVQEHAVLIEDALRLDLAALRCDAEVDDLQVTEHVSVIIH